MFCCCDNDINDKNDLNDINDNKKCPHQHKYKQVKKRLLELDEMMDVYDITCSICLQLFENPHTVCSNGHNLCKKCFDQFQQTLVVGARCPTCMLTMFHIPYPNRAVHSCVRWYNAMLRKILPFSKNDQVEVLFSGTWLPARIIDMDLHKMVYAILPSVPWKTMRAMTSMTLIVFQGTLGRIA